MDNKNLKKTVVPIKGMHCRSCELLIEDELKSIPGVKQVQANERKACAVVFYARETLNVNEIEKAVQKAGYEVGLNEKKPLFSKNFSDYIDILYAVIALFFLYIIIDILGVTKVFTGGVSTPTNLVTVLVVGLTAGFSTCMALVGGLVLGLSAKHASKRPNANALDRFSPHLLFGAGRVISYTVFGGIIGAVGSFFQLSGYSLGLMTLAVALVMLTLGMQLTGLSPRVSDIKFTLPKEIANIFGIKRRNNQEYSHWNSFLLGASTFFLPCGFTQAMQLYAISSGSFVSGATIMGVFALGTAPGLLGIGGLTSIVKGAFAQKFFKFAGVTVIALSLFNLNNAFNLLGWDLHLPINQENNVLAATTDNTVKAQGAAQIVRMNQVASGYEPNSFTIKKGVPVRWIINSIAPGSCASSIVSSKINLRKNLKPGENIIEFTPQELGNIPFSCSMGMYRGVFKVVDDNSVKGTNTNERTDLQPVDEPVNLAGSTCGSGGCGCGGGSANRKTVEDTSIQKTDALQGEEQVIKTVYTNNEDIIPNTFTVKSGKPVRMEILAKDEGYGCMSSIMIPGLTTPEYLEKGKTIVFNFTPSSKGEHLITCGMGMPRGKIKVV